MTSEVGTVTVERDGDVAVVRLRRERKLNALSAHMEAELQRALRSAEVRTSRAIVLTGGDVVFSAGADVEELQKMTTADIIAYYRGTGAVYEDFAALPQPTVAAITGYCLGGGLELALAADLRVADANAVFGFPEIDIGILPSSGGVTRIVRMVGGGRARDLVLRCKRFDAADAERWGLVSEIAAPGEQVAHAVAIARSLTKRPSLALALTKQIMEVGLDVPREAALLLEQLAYAVLNERSDPPRA